MNLFAGAVVAGFGVVFASLAIADSVVWLAVVGLALVLLGGWVAYRSVVLRVSFNSDSLEIVGFLRTRRIPRSAVLSVEQYDLEMPMIQWASGDAPDRWSILTPLALNSSPFLPATMYLRRHRFLAQLRNWAPDSDATNVRPGLWTRTLDAVARVFEAVSRSPALRIVLAAVFLAACAGAYWFGVTATLGALQNGGELGRGAFAPVALAAVTAEGAFWLIPLRNRNLRAWYVALAVAMAPLAVLTVLVVFS